MLCNAFNVEAGVGAGRFRGGLGTIREYRIDADGGGSLLASLGRSVERPWGVDGGHLGTSNYFEVVRATGEVVRGGRVTSLPLAKGDVVRIVTGNGGGWGDPRERDVDLIAADVANGLLTKTQASALYGSDGTA
jgi:N-methylhydantoinase B